MLWIYQGNISRYIKEKALDISRKKPPTSGATSKNSYTLFLYKNKLYKNNEAELGQKIRTNLEHFEAGKCKDKKK